jgi:hypothetical protein
MNISENQTIEVPAVSQKTNLETVKTPTLYDFYIALPVLIAALTPLILGILQFLNNQNKNKK